MVMLWSSLATRDVRLTMGGEPTFVSVDDREGAEIVKKSGKFTAEGVSRLTPQQKLNGTQLRWFFKEALRGIDMDVARGELVELQSRLGIRRRSDAQGGDVRHPRRARAHAPTARSPVLR